MDVDSVVSDYNKCITEVKMVMKFWIKMINKNENEWKKMNENSWLIFTVGLTINLWCMARIRNLQILLLRLSQAKEMQREQLQWMVLSGLLMECTIIWQWTGNKPKGDNSDEK